MTRETKIGLLVAGSFLCLVGIVVASKWNRGEGTDAEEQTVAPGAVLHPTQNSTDGKSNGKSEPAPPGPGAVAAAEKGKGNERRPDEAKPKGPQDIPRLLIPAPGGAGPRSDPEVMADLQRLAQNKEGRPTIDPIVPVPAPGGLGTPPPLPAPGGVVLPPPGGVVPPPGGVVVPPPGGVVPPPSGVGAPPPLPTPGGVVLPPPGGLVPPPGGVGTPPPLPTPGGVVRPPFGTDGAIKPGRAPMPGGIGSMEITPGKPFEGGAAIPDAVKPPPMSDPFGSVPPIKPIAPPPADPFGSVPPIRPTAPPPPADPFGSVPPIRPTAPPPMGDPFGSVPPIRPTAPPPGPIAVIPPTGAVMPAVPPLVVGSGRPPVVNDVNIDLYECQRGDSTFAILSLRMYGNEKYADALLQYNREHSGMVKNGSNLEFNPPVLNPGQPVLKPPQALLDRDYRTLIRTGPPQVRMDTPTPLTPTPPSGPIAKVSNPPSSGGTYTVQNPAGESVLDIAERVYGDRSQWHKIYRVNPNYPPQNRIPAGTQLTLPGN